MLIGAIIFKEKPDFFTLIGAGIIVVSGLYAFLREAKIRSSIEINTNDHTP